MPPDGRLEHLFTPLELGPVTIPCRIVSTAHQTTLAKNHVPSEELLAYHEARARGGVGLIIIEAAAIEPSGLVSETMMAGYLPKTLDGYTKLKRIADRYGTKLFTQLFHSGREHHDSGPRQVAVSSAAVPSRRYHAEPRAMTTGEVEAVIEHYSRCAGLAAQGGLDGLEISAAHNYLPEQFFTEETNGRGDRFAEPARFLTEVIEATRRAAPGLAVGVRLTASAPAAQAVAPGIAPLIDFLHVTVGDSATYVGGATIVPPPPWPRNMVAGFTGPFLGLGTPVIATGRIAEPADAEEIIASGRADAVGMNRALITDPDMPSKARSGALDSVIVCIGCNVCNEHYHASRPIACGQNPRTGRERELPRPVATSDPKRVVVVGGGPAGLAGAAEAAAAGHEVLLYEARPSLGGQVAIAAAAPAHAELALTMLRNYGHLLDLPNVRIELGVHTDVETVSGLDADCVLIATGARPYESPLELAGVKPFSTWEVLAGGERPQGRVVIADWGGDTAALDCAELLAAAGATVTIASGALVAGEALHQYVRTSYLRRLHRAGVKLEPHLELAGASGGTVHFRNVFASELERSIDADAIVLAIGRVPDDTLPNRLAEAGIAHRTAGDCRSPRGIEEAILEGTIEMRALLGLGVEAAATVA
jgi:2,4-dienoyl-CoA reductase-like NADH-dependent reductase (Old Yellow Enzyme family)/thioredoxin reductase